MMQFEVLLASINTWKTENPASLSATNVEASHDSSKLKLPWRSKPKPWVPLSVEGSKLEKYQKEKSKQDKREQEETFRLEKNSQKAHNTELEKNCKGKAKQERKEREENLRIKKAAQKAHIAQAEKAHKELAKQDKKVQEEQLRMAKAAQKACGKLKKEEDCACKVSKKCDSDGTNNSKAKKIKNQAVVSLS
ncbi:uncharacterized protein MELLADRAFT_104420 [Melampsora larici-populina 98AG31]|uniref:Uncharacterized protein n=1 Tax=Melampsora larici-populina (strain 98AG31 / pathotype 3-4-7) TaxID=747676 RepID=F4REM1_MELLP|nr:uncharacterized protein MELLADRAFT_104420 [Melampsora larici-populina 98AG31]EGG09122.1 hypothetical protein MELLADRAFT_104420 [Melampsora larici-populina 98AG31]